MLRCLFAAFGLLQVPQVTNPLIAKFVTNMDQSSPDQVCIYGAQAFGLDLGKDHLLFILRMPRVLFQMRPQSSCVRCSRLPI